MSEKKKNKFLTIPVRSLSEVHLEGESINEFRHILKVTQEVAEEMNH